MSAHCHNILEPLPASPMKPTKECYLYTEILFFAHKGYLFVPTGSPPFSPSHLIIPLRLYSSIPHSSNATYTYNSLGIIYFHKNGVLTGLRMLWYLHIINSFSYQFVDQSPTPFSSLALN
jgi:hypothetical protein